MSVSVPIYGNSGFGFMGAIVPLIFLVVIGIFVVVIVKGVSQWHTNNQSPRLTVAATLVAKRADTQVHHHNQNVGTEPAGGFHTTSSTTYYATFQVESGDRMEFSISGTEFGQVAEGDRGQLTFQGTRYLGFVREGTEFT